MAENENITLLNFVYQNSQMGVNTINQLLGIIEGEDSQQIRHRRKGPERLRKGQDIPDD